MRTHAVLAGLDPRVEATARLMDALAPKYRPPTPRVLDSPALYTAEIIEKSLEDIAAGEVLWIWLVGRVVIRRRLLELETGQPRGLVLDSLAALLEDRKGPTLLVLEVEGETEALAALETIQWPALALRTRVGETVRATLSAARGPVTAEMLGPSALPNLLVHDGAHEAAASGATELRAWRKARRDDLCYHPWGRGLTLTELYVKSSAVDAGRKKQSDREDTERITLHELAARHRALFLVGDPGSGKTTFLRRLAIELHDAALAGSEPPAGLAADQVPLLVVLADYAASGPPSAASLRAYALAQSGQSVRPPPEPLENVWKSGRVLLLLDGLDEVPGVALRNQVGRAITALAREQGGLRFIATCRPAAATKEASPGAPCVTARLEDFDADQQRDFVGQWMALNHAPDEAVAQSKALLTQLTRHPDIDRHARNPLVLTLICDLFAEKKRLPDDRVELYHELIEHQLGDRDRPGPGPVAEMPLARRRQGATDIAWLWRFGTGVTVREDQARQVLEIQSTPLFTPVEAADLIRFFEHRAAFLRWQDTDPASGERRLVFVHRTLAEYLVACRLCTMGLEKPADVPQPLQAHAHDGDWREVALLYVSRLVHDAGTSGSAEPAWTLIKWLARQAQNPGRPADERAAIGRLAAQCLAEVRKAAPENVVEAVDDGLQKHFAEPAVAATLPDLTRVEFWEAIAEHDRRMTPENRWELIPAGRYWFGKVPEDKEDFGDEGPFGWAHLTAPFFIHRWPVTIAEFAEFVEANGYADSTWWDGETDPIRALGAPDRWDVQQRGCPVTPVTGISWWEARAWCRWKQGQPDALPAPHLILDLPWEHEWETAARGPQNQRIYPWGAAPPPGFANFTTEDSKRLIGRPSPPGAWPQTIALHPHRLWDQVGNIWQWCGNAWTDQPALPAIANTPSQAPLRVVRGGSWAHSPRGLRVSSRGLWHPGVRFGYLGFRCVAAPAPRAIVL